MGTSLRGLGLSIAISSLAYANDTRITPVNRIQDLLDLNQCSALLNGGDESPPPIAGTLNFSIAPWRAECQAPVEGHVLDCGLPRALLQAPVRLNIELARVSEPGTAASSAMEFKLPQDFTGKLTVFSVHPAPERGLPPYLQLRLELAGPARALCIQSVRWRWPFQAPPMICAGLDAHGQQWGATLTL